MRLKDVTEFCPAYSGGARNDTVAFVPMEALRYDSISQQEIPFDEARGKYTFFADGDLLFAKVTPCFENGNIAVAKDLKGGIGFGSSEIFVLRAKPGLNNRYLFYVVQSSPFMDGGCATMCGVGGLKRMSPLFPRTFEWEIPNEKSQRRIVAYLDGKTAAIDARVAVLEKKLAAYKRLKASVINRAVTRGLDPKAQLKDSGVDWIGKVPVGWDVRRIRDLGACSNGLSKGGEYFGHGFPFVSYGDVYRNPALPAAVKGLVESTREERDLCSVKRGDVLFTRTSETVEELGFASTCLADIPDATFAGFLIRVRPHADALMPEFSKHYFRGAFLRQYFIANTEIVTRASLSQDLLKGLPVLCPPLDEQRAIADYLDAECAKIDKKTELVTREIELYKKLKRSLINEVVTGKRAVA